MLIDGYSVKTHSTPNIRNLSMNAPMAFDYKGMKIPTLDPDIFDRYAPGALRELFDDQVRSMMKELDIQIKYDCISKFEAERTKKQYNDLFFFEKDGAFYGFMKDIIIEKSIRETQKNKTMMTPAMKYEMELEELVESKNYVSISEQEAALMDDEGNIPVKKSVDKPEYIPEDDETDESLDDKFDPRPKKVRDNKIVQGKTILSVNQSGVIGVSIKAIREITGYSYYVKMPWHTESQFIRWQKDMMDDASNILVVDGSRQGGKSKGIAEKLLEESFVPGADCMVAAFMQETTESIWDYMLEYIENFDESDFTIKERKRYIQNNLTGVRVHFRTLMNGGKGIRGKTLRFIVVDEAMLVPEDVFTSVILPTQTTIAEPRLVLLGTASEDTSCYMYRVICDYEKGNVYNGEGQYTCNYIKFSILDNPIASPKKVQNALDTRDLPSTQREYFNKWGKLEDSLFQIKPVPYSSLRVSTEGVLLLTIDPARKTDRSAYALSLCMEGRQYLIETGEVPIEFKLSFEMQADFFKKLRMRYSMFSKIVVAGDKTAIGEGFFEILHMKGFNITCLIHYVSGDTISEQTCGYSETVKVFVVGKSLLINNFIDTLTEGTMIIAEESNQLLIQETERIQATTTRFGKISFKTSFFDDITNATMVNAFVAKKMGYINAVIPVRKDETDGYMKSMQAYNKRNKKNKGASSTW